MTEDEKAEIVKALREFVLRVSSDTDKKTPEEVNILPAIAKVLFDNNHTFTLFRASQSTGANQS